MTDRLRCMATARGNTKSADHLQVVQTMHRCEPSLNQQKLLRRWLCMPSPREPCFLARVSWHTFVCVQN